MPGGQSDGGSRRLAELLAANTVRRTPQGVPQSVANQNTANAVKKRRSSNPAQAAMTGAGILANSALNVAPLTTAFSAGPAMGPLAVGMPLAGPAIGALLHALMNKPGFKYNPVEAGRMSSEDLRRLGNVFPQTAAEKHRRLMGPGLDAEVGGSGRTRKDIQQEGLLHQGGPLAFSLAHRETLDPDIRKRLAGVIPEDADVHFRELGQGDNRFTDIMRDGSLISRTPGHMLPVHEAFGLPMQKFNSGGDVTGGGHNMRSKRAAELLHEAFGLPVQRFYSGGSAQSGGREGSESPSSRGFGGGGGGGATGSPLNAPTHQANVRAAIADAAEARDKASFNAQMQATVDLNRQQQAEQNKAAEAAKSTGFLENAWNSLFTKDRVDRTQAQERRDAASPGPDFDFLQNQAAPGIAGLLPGASSSTAGTGGDSSYYDAARLAMITGITVEQAQAYLDSMYGTA